MDYVDATLPLPLQRAQERYDAWVRRQLLGEQAASTPSLPIYHYTDWNGLRGILQSQQLRCFSHLTQKDRTEFIYSLNFARQVARDMQGHADQAVRNFAACLDDIFTKYRIEDYLDFYICSFTTHRDDEDHWQCYGRQGTGFAIGFSHALFQPTVLTVLPRAIDNQLIGRIIYGDSKALYRHRRSIEKAADIFSKAVRQNAAIMSGSIEARFANTMCRELLASQLVWNCLTAKKQEYSVEQEIRLVVMGTQASFGTDIKPGERPYIETGLPLKAAGMIPEILIGRSAPSDSKEKVKELLDQLEYDRSIPIIKLS